jgi:hypothetical protein
MAAGAQRDVQVVNLSGARLEVSSAFEVVTEADGHVTLQPPPPATGAVWISVITAEPPPGMEGVAEFVRAAAVKEGRSVQELLDGKVIAFDDATAEEGGRRLLVRTCQIGIEKTLGIVQVVIPESDLGEKANQALLDALPAMAESFEPMERTEFIETPTGTVQTKVSTMPAPRAEAQRRPFVGQERKQLEEFVAFADGLVGRYATFSKDITPRLLDTVFTRWMQDADREKADGESVSLAIGSAFGECLKRTLGLEWMVVSDDQGEAWALSQPGMTMMVFPIESVRKRVESGETNFLHGLSQVVESHLKSERFAAGGEA